MALETTDIVSTDIYRISEFIDNIKAKYVDIPEDTLILGIYGYLSSVLSNLMENTTIMASEYSNEAIPTKAKYERNIIAHALALGINNINATPAQIDMLIGLPEEALIANMTNDEFTLDKEYIYQIGEREQYPFILDYDIIIRRNRLPNGQYVYTARYDIDGKNKLAELQNPYLPAMGAINVSGDRLIALNTTLRQMTHTQIYKKIVVNNPLETKVMNFSFEDQLAFFYVDVVEDGETHYLEPVYDGLYDYDDSREYINYMYLDEKNIRLRFNRDSYQPRENAEVTIHIYTTLGEVANFDSNGYEDVMTLTSNRFPYTGMWTLIQATSDSHYGADKYNIDQLKQIIPQEALSRGSISTYADLSAAFNRLQIENETCRLYLLRRVHNQIERIYFTYLLMKEGDNVIPTNTINTSISKGMFSTASKDNYSMLPGAIFYVDPDTGDTSGITSAEDEDINRMDKASFLYTCPYLTVLNKSPFYISYYVTFMNYTRNLYFEFINEDSLLQFVALNFYVHRDYFTDPDTYKIELHCTQNINSDFQLITYDDEGNVDECNLDIYAVLYTTNTDDGSITPYRYLKSELKEFNEADAEYVMEFKFKTNDVISKIGTYMTTTSGMYGINSNSESTASVLPTMYIKFFFCAKLDREYGRYYGDNQTDNFDDIVPGLDEYTLTNVYNAGELGIDIFYDYSDIQTSYIELNKGTDGALGYYIYKMPVVRYTWLNSESRLRYLFSTIDLRRRYIQNILFLLEDSFGIDYKFFNTYGPSLMYNIQNEENIDRINLSLKFEIKFQMESDKVILSQITSSIKEYIEDINNISDLHMPNLITYITNIYREHIVYIKFIALNNYDSLYQSIYKNPEMTDDYFVETQTVPEFINVNTLNNDLPDIEFTIVS